VELRVTHYITYGSIPAQPDTYYVDCVEARVEFTEVQALQVVSVAPSVFGLSVTSKISTYNAPSITERGFVYGTSPNPTTADTKLVAGGTTTGTYTNGTTGLLENTTYHVRAYMIDSGQTFYSDNFETSTLPIAIEPVDATGILPTKVTLSATISPALSLTVTERGFVWSENPLPTLDSNVETVGFGDGFYTRLVENLDSEKEYYARAYLKYGDPSVTFYSGVISFVTLPLVLIPKTFFYRFFDRNGVYQDSFRENGFDITSVPSFSWKINGGKGILELDINAELAKATKWLSTASPDILQCIVHDSETDAKGEVLFTGTTMGAGFQITPEGHSKIEGASFASAELDLNSKQVQDISGNTSISYSNMDYADIFKDLFEKYQLQGGFATFTTPSVNPVGFEISITFKNESFLEALQRLAGFLPRGWYWYLDGDNVFHLDQTDFTNISHVLWVGKEVSDVTFDLSYADIVNEVYFSGGETGTGELYRKKRIQSSVNNYGVRAERISDGRVTSVDTAELKMDNLLAFSSYPIRIVEFTVEDGNLNRSGYDIESLRPGDSIQILDPSMGTDFTRYQNPAGTLGNGVYNQSFYNYDVTASLGIPFQIQEIKYEGNKAIIRSSDRIANQAQTIRQLEKQQLAEATLNSPDSPN